MQVDSSTNLPIRITGFQCPHCPTRLTRRRGLLPHIREKHTPHLPCLEHNCDYKWIRSREFEYRRHLRRKHGLEHNKIDEILGRPVRSRRNNLNDRVFDLPPPPYTSVLPYDTSVLPNDTFLLPNYTSLLPNDTSLLPNDTFLFPNYTSLLPNDTSLLPNDTSLLPYSSLLPHDTSLLPPLLMSIEPTPRPTRDQSNSSHVSARHSLGASESSPIVNASDADDQDIELEALGRRQEYTLNELPPPLGVKLTGYRLLFMSVMFSFGMAKAILTYMGKSTMPTTLDWVSGAFLGVFLYWIGLYESECSDKWKWFFQVDLAPVFGYCFLLFMGGVLSVLFAIRGSFAITSLRRAPD